MPATVGLTNPIFTDLEAARKHFEAIRWPQGCYCPFCGSFDRVAPLGGKSMGAGWYHCKDCRKKFTAAVGTIYERSHIPMTKWLLATHLMCASKKGLSASQLHRMIGLPYKTAWFMAHRIREGMLCESSPTPTSRGGAGRTVEADETNIGGKEKNKHRGKRNAANIGGMGKEITFALVERGGRVRTQHVADVTAKALRETLVSQLHADTKLMTDDAGQYRHMHKDFAHEVVNHGIGEYVRGNAHTNTIERHFSVLKHRITGGTYHHVSARYLKRYLAEFDFRYDERSGLNVTDTERATKAVKGVVGKRATYRQPDSKPN